MGIDILVLSPSAAAWWLALVETETHSFLGGEGESETSIMSPSDDEESEMITTSLGRTRFNMTAGWRVAGFLFGTIPAPAGAMMGLAITVRVRSGRKEFRPTCVFVDVVVAAGCGGLPKWR